MTIQEIIARYTRTGTLPVASFPADQGGNEAFDPSFDPLDHQPDQIVASLTPKKPEDPASVSEADSSSEGDKTPENGVL